MLTTPDSPAQLKEFNTNPAAYDKYCRELEGELNKRFTMVAALTFASTSDSRS